MRTDSPVYQSKDGRQWVIMESHPQTTAKHAVCRAFEANALQHTAVFTRSDLTLVSKGNRNLVSRRES